MKTDIHPDYMEAQVSCSCGNTFTTRATVPEIKVELCSECHPFFTGKQKLVDAGGRVERFKRRYSAAPAAPQPKKRDRKLAAKEASKAEQTAEVSASPAADVEG